MGRRYFIASGKVGPAFDTLEERARAKYLLARRIGDSDYLVTDAIYWAPFAQGSAGLRAAADRALEVELEASTKEPEKC